MSKEKIAALVESILTENFAEAKTLESSILAEKVDEVLKSEYAVVAESFWGGGFGSVNESIEDYSFEELQSFVGSPEYHSLDEVSQDTLKSYLTKVRPGYRELARDDSTRWGSVLSDGQKIKLKNKRAGISRAIEKLSDPDEKVMFRHPDTFKTKQDVINARKFISDNTEKKT